MICFELTDSYYSCQKERKNIQFWSRLNSTRWQGIHFTSFVIFRLGNQFHNSFLYFDRQILIFTGTLWWNAKRKYFQNSLNCLLSKHCFSNSPKHLHLTKHQDVELAFQSQIFKTSQIKYEMYVRQLYDFYTWVWRLTAFLSKNFSCLHLNSERNVKSAKYFHQMPETWFSAFEMYCFSLCAT